MGDGDDARVTGEAAGPSGRRTMDGCVVYEIGVTTASDFECLLVALDEGMSYVIDPPPFHTLAAILRAASALQFKTLQTWATRTLEQMWPSDISDLTEEPVPNAAATVILAKQCGVPKVLKRAYYELLRTSAFGQGSLDDGADAMDEDEEDEIQIISVNGRLESAMPKNATNQNKSGRTRLPHAEIVRLIETRQRLLADWVTAAAAPEPFKCSGAPSSQTDEPPAASSSAPSGSQKPPSVAGNGKPVACVAADRAANDAKWSRLVLRGQIFENYLYDPIIGLDQLCEIKWRQEGYCKKCHDARIDAWRRRQKKLWDNLDAWLGLPTGRR
ncbi:hypothetical protein EWM64_g1753 [Hericium alpestre]|uniref:BTB domain-containing protein n=1 Tax=Hericium alpestre TaxID=135208 RepID=A0A4Z0A7K3_9AGAM|nr:hypothetical protein EWM64_g1753 [Hericium alpestre]